VNRNKPYLFQSFAIIVIAVMALIVFKQFLPRKIFTETTKITENVVIDSLVLEAVQSIDTVAVEEKDTLVVDKKIVFKKEKNIQFSAETVQEYKGYQHLIDFYEKLSQLEETKEGKVRIAYFGDSMTDGDMIVKDLRAKMQDRFGGEGVGFVSITSESASARGTLKHKFSKNWETLSYLNVKKPRSPFGVSGHVFFTENDTVNPSWVQYTAYNQDHISKLNAPTLFYGQSNNQEGNVSIITRKDTIYKDLNPERIVNKLTVAPYDLKKFKAKFTASDSIPFYGFNFDNGKGVHVDNFSSRGNSGLPISIFNTEVMQAFNDELGYDLIVLHYGTNVLNYGSFNYRWYERRMSRVVDHIRECFPGVAILIISTADKSTKYGMEMKTDSAVVPLTLAQRRYAIKKEAAFVNLYSLMGGNGSMVRWVEGSPALASKDYTHFNYRGAVKVGKLIYKQIDKGYEQYKKMKALEEILIIKEEPATEVKEDSLNQKTDSIHAE